MTDAGEKLEARALAWWRENGENACNTNDLVGCIRAELERALQELSKLEHHPHPKWDKVLMTRVSHDLISMEEAVAAIRKLKE